MCLNKIHESRSIHRVLECRSQINKSNRFLQEAWIQIKEVKPPGYRQTILDGESLRWGWRDLNSHRMVPNHEV